jgi:hypothetical protein
VRRIFPLFVMAAILAACAATPMQSDVWQSTVNSEAARLGLETRCCTELGEVPSKQLNKRLELSFDEHASIVKVERRASPALRLDLDADSAGASLEFFSYSDKKRGALRLGTITFIRPSFTFLSAEGSVVLVNANVPLCYGEKNGYGGVWSRVEIPAGAASVVISSGIAKPVALIDTRKLWFSAGVAAEIIADSRQSYIHELRVGLTGIAAVEVVSPDAAPLGRCVSEG